MKLPAWLWLRARVIHEASCKYVCVDMFVIVHICSYMFIYFRRVAYVFMFFWNFAHLCANCRWFFNILQISSGIFNISRFSTWEYLWISHIPSQSLTYIYLHIMEENGSAMKSYFLELLLVWGWCAPRLHKVANAPHVDNLPSPTRPVRHSDAIVLAAPAANQDLHFLILFDTFAIFCQ